MATNAEIEEGIKQMIWQHQHSKEHAGPKSEEDSAQTKRNRPSSGHNRQRHIDRPPDGRPQPGASGTHSQNKYWQMRQPNRKGGPSSGHDRQQYANKIKPKQKMPFSDQKEELANRPVGREDTLGKPVGRDQRRRPRKQKSRTDEDSELVDSNQGSNTPKKFELPKAVRQKSDGADVPSEESNAKLNSLKKKKKKKKKRPGKDDDPKGKSDMPETPEQSIIPLDIHDLLNPDLFPAGDVLNELASEYIHPLKKRSLKFPSAKFFCRLCEYHCDTVTVCWKHMKDTRHQRLRMIKTTDILLRSLPPPSDAHIAVLDKLTEEVYKQNALCDEEFAQRQEVAKHVTNLIKEKLPEAQGKIQVYGSTATAFALKDSDLNMDLTAPDSAKVLANLHLVLADDQSGYFSYVKSDFGAKVPSVLFRMSEYNLKCQVGVNSGSASQTTQLLQIYSSLEPRLRKLAVVFRYWARLCQVDCQDAGTLPPYAFAIMTVYYLQQCEPPVLPVLDELVSSETKVTDKNYLENLENLGKAWSCENGWSLGQLWVGLLQFYAIELDISSMVICIRQRRPLTRNEKKWASKKLAIEDPFARKRNIARSVSHSHVFEYIYDRFRAAYLYYGVPQTKNGTLLENVDKGKLERKLQEILKRDNESPTSPVRSLPGSRKESVNKPAVVKPLKVDLSKKNILEKDQHLDESPDQLSSEPEQKDSHPGDSCEDEKNQEVPDCLPSQDEQPKPETDSNQTKDASSDEMETQEFALSLAEHVISSALAEISLSKKIEESSPASKGKIIECGLELSDSDNDLVCDRSSDNNEDVLDTEDGDQNERQKYEEQDSNKDADEEGLSEESDLYEDAKEDVDEEAKIGEDESQTDITGDTTSKSMESSGLYDPELLESITMEDLVFKFDRDTLSDGKGPAIMCSICQQEGHLKQNCPEERLPDLEPLPPLTKSFKHILDQIILKVPRDFEPRDSEVKMRNEVLKEIESYVRQTYPKAHLTLFGSSCNGFGFGNSDLDICMTVENETSETVNCVGIIETLAIKLKKHRGLYNVLAITTAKVPIVKFRHRRTQLEGDISLYNTLAQHNTRMLQLYSEADYRVKPLGYTLKVFGKLCNICDASRGSLSSYAYIIMVLYFLQQRKPPVIPVLQEVFKEKKPELIVEGWNAWYYDDLKNLPQDWEGYGKNKESVGELWLGLLRFYTEEFNFRDYVISVRQQKPLTRFEKLWNGKCIAIEDPFDMSHNLGAGVSRKMNMYIMKALRSGRKVFGTPLDKTPLGYNTLSDYLFDPQLLTEGEPPNDRGCRVCGKIGHFAKECPIVVARKERNERERERRKEDIDSQEDSGRNSRPDHMEHADFSNDVRDDRRDDRRGNNRDDYRNEYGNSDHRRQRDTDSRHGQNKVIPPLMSLNHPSKGPLGYAPDRRTELSDNLPNDKPDIRPLMTIGTVKTQSKETNSTTQIMSKNNITQGSSARPIPPNQRQYGGGCGMPHGVSPHADMSPHSPFSGHAFSSSNFGSSPSMNQSGPPSTSHQVFYNSRLREQQSHQGTPAMVAGNRHQQDFLTDNQESFTWQQKQFLGSSPGRHHSTGNPGQAQPYNYNNPNKGAQYGGGGGGGPPQFQSPQPFQQEWTEHWVMQQQQMQAQFSVQQQQQQQQQAQYQAQQQQQASRPRQPQQYQPQQLAWHQQQQAQQLGQTGGSGGGRGWQPQQQHEYAQGSSGGVGGSQWDHQGPPNVFGDHRVVTSANNRSLEVRVANEHYQNRFPEHQEEYHRGLPHRGSANTQVNTAIPSQQGPRRPAPPTQRLFSR